MASTTPPIAPISLNQALSRLPGENGEPYALLLKHGTLELEIYAPRGRDPQTPHTRDELYVIAAGTGIFENDGRADHFSPGDVLFVPAGKTHRFIEFSDDFAVWVMFYGPEGGETPETGPSA